MKTRRYLLPAALLIFAFSALVLISGHDMLLRPLSEEPYFPFGTLLSWAGILALYTIVFVLYKMVLSSVRKPEGIMKKFM